jgi:hypothetical protein
VPPTWRIVCCVVDLTTGEWSSPFLFSGDAETVSLINERDEEHSHTKTHVFLPMFRPCYAKPYVLHLFAIRWISTVTDSVHGEGAVDSFPRRIFSPPAHLVLRRGPPFIMARGNRRCMLPRGEVPCAWIQRGSAEQQSRRGGRTM